MFPSRLALSLLICGIPALAFQNLLLRQGIQPKLAPSTKLELTSLNRRDALMTIVGITGWLSQTVPSNAADGTSTSTKNPYDLVRFELYDPKGGVALMQKRIDARDFEGLLEFTKGYDQVLRKQYMGKAKKMLPKELQEKATIICNSVTFDLIGINRNSRKGQENYEGTLKYLNELKQDAEKLLALESYVTPAE
ncbi:hypothetical protein MPSEU_000168300 [Mayamaea pseudoterrestris]|nr:hypothetical protein MPSEU_000168300 [Mayamaea pseudoterrestris]